MSSHLTNNKLVPIINTLQLKEPNYRLIFINGKFAAHLSTPRAQLPAFLRHRLNAKKFLLKLPPHKIISSPIHLLFITTKKSPTNLVIAITAASQNAALIIEEHVTATKKCSSNITTQIIAAKNSQINYTKLFHNLVSQPEATYSSQTTITQHPTSNVSINYGIKGQSKIAETLHLTLQEKTRSKVSGWCDVGKNQNVTFNSNITHQGNAANSEELVKFIVRDNGRGSFSGNILVPQDVKQSSAKLSNKNLLLSPKAQIHTAPTLEIYADDVMAQHGSATGQLDKEALFYLQTRGLKLKDARAFLTQAFIAEVTAQFPAILQDKIGHLSSL